MGVNSLDRSPSWTAGCEEEYLGGRGGCWARPEQARSARRACSGPAWSRRRCRPGRGSLDEIAVVDDKLRDVLRGLGASPVRVYGKRLFKSDRVMNQHRLLMSCRSWRHGEPFPFDEVLTAEEKPCDAGAGLRPRSRPYVLDFEAGVQQGVPPHRRLRRFLTENGLAVPKDAKGGGPGASHGSSCGQDAPHADAAIAEVGHAAPVNPAAMPFPVVTRPSWSTSREDANARHGGEADDGAACPGANWPDARDSQCSGSAADAEREQIDLPIVDSQAANLL
ncbi:hypothetical protein ZWY2020_014027 [Hordeum vulgare]|nr:hypothetical protein ZWY2020_014027 [Hordeum vulgare]